MLFKRSTTMTRMWAPKGQQPQVLSAPTNQKIGYFGAINSFTGELFTETNHPFNGETFELFLTNFLATKGRDETKIVMILDNATWHKQAVKNLEAQFPNSFKALFLPPYSPDLNPIERLVLYQFRWRPLAIQTPVEKWESNDYAPVKDVPIKTVKSICKQAKIDIQ